MTILDELGQLSAAEDFFRYLDLPFRPDVLHVARLHIMRRFGEYLRSENLDGLSDEDARLRCRNLLQSASDEFVSRVARGQGALPALGGASTFAGRDLIPASALCRASHRFGV